MTTDTHPLTMPKTTWLMLLSIAFGGKLVAIDGELMLRRPDDSDYTKVPATNTGLDELEERWLLTSNVWCRLRTRVNWKRGQHDQL